MNRTKIRGVTAGVVAGAALSVAAAITAPAIANGAESDPTVTPLSAAAQRAIMHWQLPAVPSLRPLHLHLHARPTAHRTRHHPARASRAAYRSPLTGSPQTVAHALVLRRGWGESGWSCLDALWMRESHWNTYAVNASSGAYGIPQALPATKMATAGADWRTNPLTQIQWGLSYIAAKYGAPCVALSFSSAHGYY